MPIEIVSLRRLESTPMMYPSNGDVKDNTETARHSPAQQTNRLSPTEKPSTSACPALLVIDDNSNSEDTPLMTTSTSNVSSRSSAASNPTAVPAPAVPPPPPLPPSHHSGSNLNFISAKEKATLDLTNDTPEQQRRRNSSIAKLLGGQPLNNQQYEEIHQQILDDQSAQNQNNSHENGIQRSRSSITRTLLMNSEKPATHAKNLGKTPPSSKPAFAKDFDYLIRDELDADQPSSGIQRNGSSPSVFPNLNPSNLSNAQMSASSRFKRKRSIPKVSSPMNLNKHPMNIPPFALHNPIELDSSTDAPLAGNPTPSNSNSIPSHTRSQREQNDVLRFNSSLHSAFSNLGHFNSVALANSSSPSSSSGAFSYPKGSFPSSLFNQFSIPNDRLTGNHRSFSFHYPHYPSSMKSSLPTPILPLPTGAMTAFDDTDVTASSARKMKSMLFGTDAFEQPRKRSYSNLSNPTITNSADSYVPLKKRLLHAYQSEQDSTSTL